MLRARAQTPDDCLSVTNATVAPACRAVKNHLVPEEASFAGQRLEAECRDDLPGGGVHKSGPRLRCCDDLLGSAAALCVIDEISRRKPKSIANWILNDLQNALTQEGRVISNCPIPPGALDELVNLIDSGKISSKQAKEVFAEMFASGKSATAIVQEKGIEQLSDVAAIEAFCDQVIASNPKCFLVDIQRILLSGESATSRLKPRLRSGCRCDFRLR